MSLSGDLCEGDRTIKELTNLLGQNRGSLSDVLNAALEDCDAKLMGTFQTWYYAQ